MTDDEIRAMPAGREMDALVAERVMGQTDFSHLDEAWEEGNTEDGIDGWSGFVCPRCRQEVSEPKCCKFYSTDIAAAWEVVEKIRQLNVYATVEALAPDYQCTFDGDGVWQSAQGDAAPLAICRAVLLAVNHE